MTPPANIRSARALRLGCAALAAATLAGLLSGCFPLAVGGAAVAGSAVDRRTAGTQIEDEAIENRTQRAISAGLSGDRVRINATSYNRQVLLTGEASTADERSKAEQLAARVENVRAVVNDIGVMAPATLSQRSNDTFITGKVKASLVDAKDISASAIKVVTERGVVYLLGRVTAREAKRSAEIARGVSGVLKVVRVFELVSEDELAQMGRQQPPAPVTSSAPPAPPPPPAAAAPANAAPITDAPPAVVVTPIR
jgi:osmotically-inducible protein OsmY